MPDHVIGIFHRLLRARLGKLTHDFTTKQEHLVPEHKRIGPSTGNGEDEGRLGSDSLEEDSLISEECQSLYDNEEHLDQESPSMTSQADADIKTVQQQRAYQHHVQGLSDAPSDEPVPLADDYERIVTIATDENQLCAAMILTKRLVRKINIIHQCERNIKQGNRQLADVMDSGSTKWTRVLDIRETKEEERSPEEQIELDTLTAELDEREKERVELEDNLKKDKGLLSFCREELFGYLWDMVKEGNLVEAVDAGKREQIVAPWIPPPPVSPTPSEKHMKLARDNLNDAEMSLHEAQDKFNNWSSYYDMQLEQYEEALEQGFHHYSRSYFDNTLLLEARAATGDLIEAEERYEDAKLQAKALGLNSNGHDQSSGFCDDIDDGYRISLEEDFITDVNTQKITRWMEREHDGDEDEVESVEVDQWESRSVEISDSVSVVAEGRERSKIDRWRSMCEDIRLKPEAHMLGDVW